MFDWLAPTARSHLRFTPTKALLTSARIGYDLGWGAGEVDGRPGRRRRGTSPGGEDRGGRLAGPPLGPTGRGRGDADRLCAGCRQRAAHRGRGGSQRGASGTLDDGGGRGGDLRRRRPRGQARGALHAIVGRRQLSQLPLAGQGRALPDHDDRLHAWRLRRAKPVAISHGPSRRARVAGHGRADLSRRDGRRPGRRDHGGAARGLAHDPRGRACPRR